MKKRVGILTSGGDCPGLNATIRGVAKALYARMGDNVEIVGIANGYSGLINGDYREMNEDDFRGILTLGGTIIGNNRTPLKLMRVVEDDNIDKVAAMKKTYKAAKLDCLLCLGGNGTHKTANLLSQEGLNIIGLPKTIDNDIYGTDVTFGFHTAVDIATDVIDRIHTTAGSHSRVMCIEIMGNKAGWLTLYSGIAGGADIILLPERPFDENVFLEKVAQLEKDRHNVIIAASEGVKNKDGVFLCDLVSTAGQLDAFGHKAILSGTSRYLADLIHVRLGCKTRAIEFSTLQRCASHLASRTDITEAYQVGGASVEAAYRGETGKMCAIRRISDMPYRTETEMVDVQKVANLEKRVPDDWISPDGMHVTEAFHHYARPLIQAELTPIYIDGVPRHLHLH